MMRLRQTLLTVGLIFLFTAAAAETACSRAVTREGPPQSQPPPPAPSAEHAPEGWQRHELEGSGGDKISVLLPQKPDDCGVANLKRSEGAPLQTRVHMLSADAKVYFALFVDLPRPAADMSRNERSDHFHGSWMAAAAMTRRVLEEKFGEPFPVTDSPEKVGEAPGGERHMQDFKVGTQRGRAQAVFAGRRIYMVVAVWDARPESEKAALRFLNSFQIQRKRQ
jgi:hypothetical protein